MPESVNVRVRFIVDQPITDLVALGMSRDHALRLLISQYAGRMRCGLSAAIAELAREQLAADQYYADFLDQCTENGTSSEPPPPITN